MNLHKVVLALLSVVTLFAAGAAHAGPKVMVTFKNNAISDAAYVIETSNEASTNVMLRQSRLLWLIMEGRIPTMFKAMSLLIQISLLSATRLAAKPVHLPRRM